VWKFVDRQRSIRDPAFAQSAANQKTKVLLSSSSSTRRRRRRLLAVEGGQEGAERFHENYARCEYRLGHTFGLPQEIVGPSFQSHTHTGLTRRENAHCLLQSIIRRLVVRGAQSNSAQSISNIDGFNRQQLG
jgi:hypothetical protein